MSVHFPIYHNKSTVGSLEIFEHGLYYCYKGSIQLEGDGIYRIYAVTQSNHVNLGVCTPENGMWHIQGKLSKQKLSLDNIRLTVNSKNFDETFIPLKSNEPFDYLEQLDHCKFDNGKDGQSLRFIAII